MKNRVIILSTALFFVLTSVLFASCAKNDENAESVSGVSYVQSNVNDAESAVSSYLSEEASEAEAINDDSSAKEQSEPEKAKSFDIQSDIGNYQFNADSSTGSYSCEFTSVTQENGDIILTLADGRNMTLSITEVVYNEEHDIYTTAINGMEFLIEESYNSANKHYQVFECIEPIEGFYGKEITTIIITYYPELEYGSLNIAFTYTVEGDVYTLNYADGQTLERIIRFDEETESYYFVNEEDAE